jgi:PAS domain S-box-containing protein
MTVAESAQLRLLGKAFTAFNHAALDLQKSFVQLESKIKELDLELESKNRKLADSLAENKKVRDFLHHILESLQPGIVVLNKGERIAVWNSAACAITGINFSRYKGRNFYQVLSKHSLLEDCTIKEIKALGYGEERVLRFRHGNDFVSILYTLTPLKSGAAVDEAGCIAILQDITGWKRLEDQAERDSRLIAMGELTAKMVSEVRNPLGSIEILASILQRELAGDAERHRIVGHIIQAVRSLDNLLANYLIFTQSPKPKLQKIPVAAWLNEAANFVGLLPRAKPLEIIKKHHARQPWIMGDRELLKQVALNLMLNAIQAMPAGGKLVIETTDEKDNPTRKGSTGIRKRKEGVAIRFADTGAGIAAEHLEKIFNPFFTTKEGGSGLGLAIVNNIVRAHGGMIEVNSATGKGTSFTIYLPTTGNSQGTCTGDVIGHGAIKNAKCKVKNEKR